MLDSVCLYCITSFSHSYTPANTHTINRSVTNQHKTHLFALLEYDDVGRRCPALQFVSVCVSGLAFWFCVAVHAVSCSVES